MYKKSCESNLRDWNKYLKQTNPVDVQEGKDAENNVNNLRNDSKVCKQVQTLNNGCSPDTDKVKVIPKISKQDINHHGPEKPSTNDCNHHTKNPVETNNREFKVPTIPKEYQKTRLSSGSKSRQRDITTTQFAVADDDNVSAVQQVTKGGGPALTLVSKWQYSFDDSEEINPELENNSNLIVPDMYQKNGGSKINGSSKCNDNKFVVFQSKDRWKGAPKETYKATEMHGKRRRPVRRSISQPAKIPPNLTVRNILNDDKKPKLLHIGDVPICELAPQGLPRCWSCPTISLHIRSHLKPPLKQQASFDENVYEVDVMRNVAAKQKLNEEVVLPTDERRTSLPYLSVAGTQTKEKMVQHVSSPEEPKSHRKSSDTAVKSLLSEINGALVEEKLSKELGDSNIQNPLPLKKSSSQKGILKKNSSDKSISFQHSNENKLQRSLSGPYDKWQKREITYAKQFEKPVSSQHLSSDKITECRMNGNVQNSESHNEYFVRGSDNPNVVNVTGKKDVLKDMYLKSCESNLREWDKYLKQTNPVNVQERKDEENNMNNMSYQMENNSTMLFSSFKNGNDSASKVKSVSLNTTAVKCYPPDTYVNYDSKTEDSHNIINEKSTKRGFISLGKSSSSKDLKSFTNGINDSVLNLDSATPQSQISRFNHSRRSLTAVESTGISDKRNVSDNVDDHQPSRIPVRFACSKNFNEGTNSLYQKFSADEKSHQKSVTSNEKKRPRSLIIWQNTNNSLHLSDEGNDNCLHENLINNSTDYNGGHGVTEQNNPIVESINTYETQNSDGKTVRRRRANPDCKYVKDESELKLNFVRRRQRPTSITSLSRIPRPCPNKQFPDRNSTFFGNSTDNVHSVCHKSAVTDTEDGLNLQRVSSMPSVPLLGEKQLPIYFQGQKVGHNAINELPQPPTDDPPPNHCLPSRFVAAF